VANIFALVTWNIIFTVQDVTVDSHYNLVFRKLIMSVSKTTGIYLASAKLYNTKNFQISVEVNTFNLCKYWNKPWAF
jgi:hypothetical protein